MLTFIVEGVQYSVGDNVYLKFKDRDHSRRFMFDFGRHYLDARGTIMDFNIDQYGTSARVLFHDDAGIYVGELLIPIEPDSDGFMNLTKTCIRNLHVLSDILNDY